MADYGAGWYPDYADARQQRFWDGQQWTHYVHRPVAEGAPRWRRRKQPTFRPSTQLVEATYRMVFADRWMVALVFAGAVLSTLAGAVGRVLERFGIGGLLAAFGLNLGWAVATVFATPVIMVEGTMPLATIRRSVSLLRGRFSVTLLSGLVSSMPWLVLLFLSFPLAIVSLGFLLFGSGAVAVAGGVVLGLSVLAIACVLAVSASVNATLQANLYRYAMGQPVPGVDQYLLPPLLPA